MPLADLDDVERDVVHACLRAAVSGPFFLMWEFSTLFGLEHQAVSDIAYGAVPLDDSREDVRIAINNALKWLAGDPHKSGQETWERFIPVPPAGVRRTLKKQEGRPTHRPFGQDVFEEML